MRLYKYLILFSILAFLNSCVDNKKSLRELGRINSDELLNSIGHGNAGNYFLPQNFNRDTISAVLRALRENCDFKNRKGNFINDGVVNDPQAGKFYYYIYEYYLKCDDTRIFIVYQDKKDNIELVGFNLSKLSSDEPRITHPERRLKVRK